MNVAVIGAGASGMAAALQAAWHGAAVTLFERNPTPGRKLLVTGSGRCNITNAAAAAARYACADPTWLETCWAALGGRTAGNAARDWHSGSLHLRRLVLSPLRFCSNRG